MSALVDHLSTGIRPISFAVVAATLLAVGAPSAKAQSFGFANFSADVKKSGATANGNGVQNSTRFSRGKYYVEFTREVRQCVYVATIHSKGGGQISVKPYPGNPNRLRIFTFSEFGVRSNKRFQLLVSCI